MSDELTQALQSLFIAALVAALAPVIVGIAPRLRTPQVVVLIVGGVIVGPQVLGLAEPDSIELLSNVGLGFLILLAGYELELSLFRQRATGEMLPENAAALGGSWCSLGDDLPRDRRRDRPAHGGSS
jgi:Kef-type K+ transport system membrane component KefB